MDNTTTITFRSQSRSVSVKAPASGYRANPEINQKVSVSGGGTIYTTDFGGETQKLQVQLRRLTRTEYTALKEFILTTCRGSAFSFDLTDYQGTHQNLHYISGLEGAELHRGDLFTVTLQLQKSTDQSLRLEQNLITNPNLKVNPDGNIEGWGIFNSWAYKHDIPDTTPATLRNQITTLEGSQVIQVLEITENDRDNEKIITSEKISLTNYQHTVSARMNRVVGARTCSLFISFFEGNNELFAHAQRTGWVSSDDPFFVFGRKTSQDENDAWGSYSIVFGPGINTYVPPTADSFKVGAFIAQAGDAPEPFAVVLMINGFSVVVSP